MSRTGTRPAVPVTSATCGVSLTRGRLRPGAGWRPGRSRARGARTPGRATRTPTAGATIPTGREVTTPSGLPATAATGHDLTTGGATARLMTVTEHGGTIPGEADLFRPRTIRARSGGGARTISGLIRSGPRGRRVSRTRPPRPSGLPPDGTNSRNHPVIRVSVAVPEARSTPPTPTPGARPRRPRVPRGAPRLRRPPTRTVREPGGTTPSGPQRAAGRASPARRTRPIRRCPRPRPGRPARLRPPPLRPPRCAGPRRRVTEFRLES